MASIHQIALTLVSGIGDVNAKTLLGHCGSAEQIFTTPKSALLKIPGIGEKTAVSIINYSKDILKTAEKELLFAEKHNIEVLFFTDKNYPKKLRNCTDSPILLYYKGNANLNHRRMVSIVGTRNATDYGKNFCQQLIADLSEFDCYIVSGLAYGIDICAHKVSIQNNIPTIGVLAHGLDKIYPSQHHNIAQKMLTNGGLLTEFRQNTKPERENFPRRNRIVAGLTDATIVVEAAEKGGALITADIANSYNKDVFALPGNVFSEYSKGCNNLIKNNQAALISSAKDIAYILGWDVENKKDKVQQLSLAINLSTEEEKILEILKSNGSTHIDTIAMLSQMPLSKIASSLLNLELQGIIKSLPGSIYSI